MTARAPLLLVLATLTLPAPGVAQEAKKSPAGAIQLLFGWEPGASMAVTVQNQRQRLTGGTRDSAGGVTRYRLDTRDHPDGLELTMRQFEFEMGDGADSSVAVVQALATASPSYVVSDAGEFVRLTDVKALQRVFDSLFAAQRTGFDAAADSLLATLMSPAVLSASAAEEWNALVGFWVGAELELGTTYELEAAEPVAFFGGAELPMRYEFSAAERMACTSGAADTACVRLELTSQPDSVAMAELVVRFLSGVAPEASTGLEDMALRVLNSITLVAEPATLRPHYLMVQKEVEVTGGAAAGDESFWQYEAREYWYAHDAPP